MFKSQQYRAKAATYGELIKHSSSERESRKFEELQDHLTTLAANEQQLADSYDSAVNVAEPERSRGTTLAAEEERVLRCLGAAIIMQWNALPKALQREIFDRFLHKHKNDADRDKPLETRRDAKSSAAALSRWDNEGGAVPDGLSK